MASIESDLAVSALRQAASRFSRVELAEQLDVSTKTLDRWERGRISSPRLVYRAISDLLREPMRYPVRETPPDFTLHRLVRRYRRHADWFRACGRRVHFHVRA